MLQGACSVGGVLPAQGAQWSCRSGCLRRLHRRKDWRLVVTGHSLGAGVAVLLAMHLRSYYPGAPLPHLHMPAHTWSRSTACLSRSACTSI